ncbi:MAG TPA: 23S rRNA (guanosine(2251)-2'-O)-methyltransferase RlmB [Phaeodactylibacter sp.]|nr:23S rRNA (guanosine(2251)-2'-O)-methyltransferase RlmB [Phaeodactylibacter sp.]
MKGDKNSIVYGRHPVVDLIGSGKSIDQVMLQQGTRGEFEKELRLLCRARSIPLKMVPKERLNRLTRSNHQGVIALLSPIDYYKLSDVLPLIYESSKVPLILLLDGITDVRNFGSIARSAECCGVDAIVIPEKGTARIHADALKTSAGALSKIRICRESSIQAALEYLQLSGVHVLASSLEAKKEIQTLDLQTPLAFIIGSEDEGVSPHLLRRADECFIIPQVGTTDSFNVAVATGIMLYEALRQRGR